MKSVTGKRMAQLALQKGWSLARINGSHQIYVHPSRSERLVIPIHGNRTLKKGLQKSLMKIIPVDDGEL